MTETGPLWVDRFFKAHKYTRIYACDWADALYERDGSSIEVYYLDEDRCRFLRAIDVGDNVLPLFESIIVANQYEAMAYLDEAKLVSE